MSSFQKAVELGAQWVEFDVRMSVDQKPMVVHDSDLSRAFGRPHRVEMTSSPVLSMFGVPRLEEVLDFLEEKSIGAYVEVKACPLQSIDTIVHCTLKNHAPRIISSFDQEILKEIRRKHAGVKLQALYDSIPIFRPSILDLIEPVELGVSASRLLFPGGTRILKWGFPVSAYTVNDAERALKIKRMGLVGVFSDYPDLFLNDNHG